MKSRHKRARRAIRKANNIERMKGWRNLHAMLGERGIPIPKGEREPRVYHVPSSPSFTTVRGSTYVQVSEEDMEYFKGTMEYLKGTVVPFVVEDSADILGTLPGWTR